MSSLILEGLIILEDMNYYICSILDVVLFKLQVLIDKKEAGVGGMDKQFVTY